ncbi:MAG: prepilin-type N-terminal cleavage/methylation domain-containing protein [Oscillatoria sp. SIO1A7]|nr:prepilin-type N-terminal cleavage/methylation domain-containing protein [Oscillatoria sp. SIO1A7]
MLAINSRQGNRTMMKGLRKLLRRRRQERKKPGGFTLGFTLIELLVAIAMGGLIITPILGLVVSLLNSDRQEQVKGRSEQELQAALDYIARDLQQAVFIYDADGVAAIEDELPFSTDANRTPVLVFWKRELLNWEREIDPDRDGPKSTEKVGCLEKIPNSSGSDICSEQDYFAFSLVAYYLIDEPGGTWSQGMRIGRWEIHDGITTTNSVNPNILPDRAGADNQDYLLYPDSGFQAFDLSAAGNNTAQKMNQWSRYPDEAYDTTNRNPLTVLVDFIDYNRYDTTSLPTPTCGANEATIPDFTKVADKFKTASFYVCVPIATPDGSDPPRKPIAEVNLRGNGLLRLNGIDRNNANFAKEVGYEEHRANFFPRSSIRVQGVGFVK